MIDTDARSLAPVGRGAADFLDTTHYTASVGQGPNFTLQIDLTSMPVNPPVAFQPGDTWNFQCWYRDVGNTNNFTDAVSVTFQ